MGAEQSTPKYVGAVRCVNGCDAPCCDSCGHRVRGPHKARCCAVCGRWYYCGYHKNVHGCKSRTTATATPIAKWCMSVQDVIEPRDDGSSHKTSLMQVSLI